MSYVIERLESFLTAEYHALEVAEGELKLNHSRVTISAFERSKEIAEQRIPELRKAIELLKSYGLS